MNYGNTSQAIIGRVPKELKSRCEIVAPLRPDQPDIIKRFQSILKDAVAPHLTESFLVKEDAQYGTQIDIPGDLVLNWGVTPKDLDLHWTFLSEKQTSVCYNNKGSKNNHPWCEYGTDMRDGSGPETVSIAKWMSGKYVCYVHNYSNESVLTSSGGIIEFECGNFRKRIQCPTVGEGSWWKVFEIDSLEDSGLFLDFMLSKSGSGDCHNQNSIRVISCRSIKLSSIPLPFP